MLLSRSGPFKIITTRLRMLEPGIPCKLDFAIDRTPCTPPKSRECFTHPWQHTCFSEKNWIAIMAEGTIKKITDKGFGFIATETGTDMFFHSSSLDGVTYEELREGQPVSYDVGRGPKGPRAENVRKSD